MHLCERMCVIQWDCTCGKALVFYVSQIRACTSFNAMITLLTCYKEYIYMDWFDNIPSYDIVLIYTFYWKSISGGKWPCHSIMQSWKTFQVEIHNVFDNGIGQQTFLFLLLHAHTNWVHVMKTLSIKYTTFFQASWITLFIRKHLGSMDMTPSGNYIDQ